MVLSLYTKCDRKCDKNIRRGLQLFRFAKNSARKIDVIIEMQVEKLLNFSSSFCVFILQGALLAEMLVWKAEE